MGENRSPDDAELHWPVARGELDDLATLELGPDDAGKLGWRNMTPPGPETYRAWLPRRQHALTPLDAPADVCQDDPVMSLFASEAAPAGPEPVCLPEPPTPTPLVGWAEPAPMAEQETRRSQLTELPLTAPAVATGAPATTSTAMPFWSTAVAAPLRLSLALTSVDARRAATVPPPPDVPVRSRFEQAALLGTGAVFGVIAALAVTAAVWRPGDCPTSASAVRTASTSAGALNAQAVIPAQRLPVATVPLARPVVPGARLAALEFPTIRPAAASIAGTSAAATVTVPATHATATVPSRRPPAPPARREAAPSRAGAAATRAPAPPAPIVAPPEALAAVGRFAAAYNRMDADATQAVWPAADHQALVTTFTALREQRLTLSGCRGTMQGDTATVMCRGTLRYRPRVGDHATRILEGTWRFAMLQRADDWVVDGLESP